MSNTKTTDVAFDPPLTDVLFFDAGIVCTTFLFILAQSALRVTTRARALEALIVALRPITHHAVESTMPAGPRDVAGDAILGAVAE